MTPRKETPLAVRRRRMAGIAAVAASVPTTYVEPPIVAVLARIQRIAETEFAFIERAQNQPDAKPMSPLEAKKFSNLVASYEKAVTVGTTVREEEMAGLTDEQLEAQLLAELERMRKRGKQDRG
jgi:hypothetical protein